MKSHRDPELALSSLYMPFGSYLFWELIRGARAARARVADCLCFDPGERGHLRPDHDVSADLISGSASAAINAATSPMRRPRTAGINSHAAAACGNASSAITLRAGARMRSPSTTP